MGIILIELGVIVYFKNKLKKKNVSIDVLLLLALILQSILLMLYRSELTFLGREVYYSDAEDYWRYTLRVLNGDELREGQQLGYILWSALIQKTSPFVAVIWNNISNLLLVDLALLLIADIMVDNELNNNKIKFFLISTMFNPLIVYSLFRNLKDAIFLLIMVLIIYFLLLFKQKKKWIYLVIAVFLDVVVAEIRPWGFLIIVFAFIGIYYNQFLLVKSGLKKVAILIIASMFVIVSYIFIVKIGLVSHINVWLPKIQRSMSDFSIMKIIMGPLSMMLGPGWYRCINGEQYFMYYTNIGNIACFIGAIMWWFVLAYFLAEFNFKKIKFNNAGLAFLITLFFIFCVYSMLYGGSVELRFRGIIYVLVEASYLLNVRDGECTGISRSIVFFVPFIFIVGTIASV